MANSDASYVASDTENGQINDTARAGSCALA